MPENEKRIVIRVDPATWSLLDDLRHSQRISFQELGTRLFNQWHSGESPITKPVTILEQTPHNIDPTGAREDNQVMVAVPRDIKPWVSRLVTIFSGSARRALEENLLAFEELTRLKEGHDDSGPGDRLQQAAEANRALSDSRRALDADLEKHDRRTRKRPEAS